MKTKCLRQIAERIEEQREQRVVFCSYRFSIESEKSRCEKIFVKRAI